MYYIFFKNMFKMAVSTQLQIDQEQRNTSLFTQCECIAPLGFFSTTIVSAGLTSFTAKNDVLTYIFINYDVFDL